MTHNHRISFCLLVIVSSLMLFTNSCIKEVVPQVPVVATTAVNNFTPTTATCAGEIISHSGAVITARGICWSTSPNPTISNSFTVDTCGGNGVPVGRFSASMKDLIQGTTYYARAYAVNSVGYGYGSVITFQAKNGEILFNSSKTYGTVTDIDGNEYKTIVIGNQTWMAQNLRTTKFNDGTDIPDLNRKSDWANQITAGYCWYDSDPTSYKNIYGALYSWDVAAKDKYCPTGWHVPNDTEWNTLINHLSIQATKVKETGLGHWLSPNIGATNDSGFTALPGGLRKYDGTFIELGSYGFWWSSTYDNPMNGRYVNTVDTYFGTITAQSNAGLSIRCIKN